MSFTFSMFYKPAYQKRYGLCSECEQGIVAGSKIVIGTGRWHGNLVSKHLHFNCYIEAVETYAKNWFFKNDYVPTAMAPDKKVSLNRLRAKRYYIKLKGGDPNDVAEKLNGLERQIAMVKSERS